MSILNKIFDALFEGLQQRIAPYVSPWKNNVETPPQFIADVRQAMVDVQHYQSIGDQGALDRAVAAWERIITSPTFSYSLQTFQLTALNEAGGVFWKRYHEKGQRTDLDKALKIFNQVVAATPTNSPDRAMYLSNLGSSLFDYYDCTGQISDLEAAINVCQQAVSITPARSLDRAEPLNNLGNSLRARYKRTGQLVDLEATIETYQQAVDAIPANLSKRAIPLLNLGTGFHDRYKYIGHVPDLEMAIKAYQQAVDAVSANSPERAMSLNNLGYVLCERYSLTGQLADLRRAIEICQQAVAIAPANSPQRAIYLNTLGMAFYNLYARTKRITDLEAAIATLQQAVVITSASQPYLAIYLNDLGSAFHALYKSSRQIEDLEAALETYQQALAATPVNTIYLAGILNNLGVVLMNRYIHTEQITDLEAAIELCQQAVDITPANSPDRAARLNNLGVAFHERHSHTADSQYRQKAILNYEAACWQAKEQHIEIALIASTNLGDWMQQQRNWIEAVRAYQYGMEAMEQLYQIQLLQTDRQSWQREARGLYAHAAYALARTGKLPEAVLILEQGQARRLNENLARDRAKLESVQGLKPTIYKQYQDAALHLRALEAIERQQQQLQTIFTPLNWTEHYRQARAAREQLNSALNHIRQLPGYETFLMLPTFEQVGMAVRPCCPLVYLITTSIGSLALMLHRPADSSPVYITPIWADSFTATELSVLLVKRDSNKELIGGYLPGQLSHISWLKIALAEGLPLLGETFIGLIAAQARKLNTSHLTLLPSGRLNLLPFHAAHYPVNNHKQTLLNEFAIAYAPSAQALRHCQETDMSVVSSTPLLLGVGNPLPLPEGVPPLPFARWEVEEIAKQFPNRSRLFCEETASYKAIKDAIPGVYYLHFSCHGKFDPEHPLASGLFLSNGERLTLADVLDRLSLQGTRLAVLSACQTAINDFNNLPDEAVGLPAGFLQAGVRGVIGSLWPVNDHSTSLLMNRFYQYHLKGDIEEANPKPLEPAEALRRAQQWLRQITRQELGDYYKSFIRLSAEEASTLHFNMKTGGSPNDKPYENPYYWAAFTLTGV